MTGPQPPVPEVRWADVLLATENLVHRLIRATFGDEVFHAEPMWQGSPLTRQVPPPAHALRVALLVQGVGAHLVSEYAAMMRGDGGSWDSVFAVLGLETQEWKSPAELAYEHVLGPPSADYPHDRRYVRWTCRSCGKRVSDSGPYNGHPADNETGHGPGCERHQAEIAAYRAARDDES